MSTITVRDAKIEDAARILEIYAYYVEYTVISFEWDVPSLEEFENRMRDINEKISIPRHRARMEKSKVMHTHMPLSAAPHTTGRAS